MRYPNAEMKDIRIGIVTHYSANNFGAVLQCKALSDAVSQLFPEAECSVLDFEHDERNTPPNVSSVFLQKKGNSVSGMFKGLIHSGILVLTKLISQGKTPTQDFINEEMNLDTHVRLNEKKQIEWEKGQPPYTALICGSDQIWAYWCLRPYYMLETTQNPQPAKLAYAPSFGNINKLQPSQLEKLKSELTRFTAISCRERDGAELLRDLMQQSCPTLPDPTMLHTRDYWMELAQKPKNFPYEAKKFVFTYRISFMPHAKRQAESTARALNLPLATCELVEPHSYYSNLGPREFLWCIANAAYVVTPSFHGTVFAIIMGTPFHVISSIAPQERLKTLLNSLGIEARYAPAPETLNSTVGLPLPEGIASQLNTMREEGLTWLRSNIQQILPRTA